MLRIPYCLVNTLHVSAKFVILRLIIRFTTHVIAVTRSTHWSVSWIGIQMMVTRLFCNRCVRYLRQCAGVTITRQKIVLCSVPVTVLRDSLGSDKVATSGSEKHTVSIFSFTSALNMEASGSSKT
jgi:hypothetical protein